MFEFLMTLILAMVIMVILSCIGVMITQPIHGALVRLRANYSPKAVSLDGLDNRSGPVLTSLVGTLKRTKRIEGWYGLYKGTFPMLMFVALISFCSIVFVGGSSSPGPKGTYSVPEAGGIRMGIFTIVLTLISLPMTVLINRSIITPYKLPMNPRRSLEILLTPHELSKPYMLYLTPGLLAATSLHSFCVTLVAGTMRVVLVGSLPPIADEQNPVSVSWWRLLVFMIFQCLAVGYLVPLEVISTRLSIQPNTGGVVQDDEAMPEGVEYCGTDEDVIGLRPTSSPYQGLLDCGRTIAEEEGVGSLYRAWWWTMLSNVAGVFA